MCITGEDEEPISQVERYVYRSYNIVTNEYCTLYPPSLKHKGHWWSTFKNVRAIDKYVKRNKYKL